MEEALLLKKERPEERDGHHDDPEKTKSSEGGRSWLASCCPWPRRRVFWEEVRRVGQVAGPMVAVTLSQYLLQGISVMMVGHLGELALSSTAIASLSFASPASASSSGLDNLGAALAISVSYWLNVVFLGVYMKYSPSCAKTCVPVSMELFRGISKFFRYAVPSALMVCLEWWSFELLILLSGLLPNPQLETSVLSVCLNTITTLYMIPYGLGAAGSTRVSNELGAGNPAAARLSVYATLFLTITETSIVSTILFIIRRVFGYTFSNEQEVVDYVTQMAPLVCLSVILDSLQGVLSGIARGCGWQHIGAFVNLGSFYLCGIPVAAVLGFWVKLRGMGLWIGIQTGSLAQAILLSIVTSHTDWEMQASKARARIFEARHSEDHVLM
ncbi:hypothetical protein NL676_037897 [Syzygium grande]|nr:hypothetical protein NL676_037897 [Syzygium grande]